MSRATCAKGPLLDAYEGLDHGSVFENPDTWLRIIGWYRKYFETGRTPPPH